MKEVAKQNKYVYLEFIRGFAIFWVIFNHTGQNGFFLFSTKSTESLGFWCYLFISVFCKVAVPLFLCISGALLLGKEDEGISRLWKKRISMMVLILIVFSVIHYLNYMYAIEGRVDFVGFIKSLYSGPGPAYGHLWYLYAYIIFLILLPFLRSLVKNLENKYFYYMIGIVIFFNVVEVLVYLFLHGEVQLYEVIYENAWINIDIILYPCIGYFLQNRLDIKSVAKKIPLLWMVNVFGILTACYMTYYMGQVTGVLDEWNSQEFISSFVVINCITIFFTTKYVFDKVSIPNFLNRIIVSFGKTTFGIYLIHLLVKRYLSETKIIPIITGFSINSMVAVLLYCMGIMFICYIIITLLLKIPIAKKLVGG